MQMRWCHRLDAHVSRGSCVEALTSKVMVLGVIRLDWLWGGALKVRLVPL